MLRQNFVKEKLESGQAVIGTWAIIPSAITADIIASSGVDFIIIDSEHGPINHETAQHMAQACESRGVSPIMRLGGVSEDNILKALDIGMHGIQIPNISNSALARKVIEYSKYPPVGNRGFSPFTRAGGYTNEKAAEHTIISNENTIIGINIEGLEAIEDIDNILMIEEIDVVFIGLFDLSKALGIPGKVGDRKVLDYLEILTRKTLDAGKYPGTIVTSMENMENVLKLGLKYILYLVDCDMLKKAYQAPVQRFQAIRDNLA